MAKLIFRYGVMGSGKSTALLQVVHNYTEKGFKCLLLKPSLDTKGGHRVISRIGIARPVDFSILKDTNIYELIDKEKPYAVVVDEVQFLQPEQIEQMYRVTKILNIPILAYGLRSDFQTKGFPGSTRLLELADEVEELRTICDCGKKATQNLRLLNGTPTFDGEQNVIDDKTEITYKSVCGECYLKLKGEL